ncbi:autotransporter family protein [Methylobacter sp. YRD-M1]|uniref:autotransporter family protein n=1 Tax=Methylobacter sp. YRD-M1 TaxID=2911520 RepID=UPI00227A6A76|nr:Calx-beta domain-containing protein [Methylobacter sp. YRD-M1]WAK00370.1 autotransporter domain-containing protein [Methylobacter sp. YRD-M1]
MQLPLAHPRHPSVCPEKSTSRSTVFQPPRLYGSKPVLLTALSMMALTPISADAWILDFTPNSYTVDEATGTAQIGITITQEANDYGGCSLSGTVAPIGGSAIENSDFSLNGGFAVQTNFNFTGVQTTYSTAVSLNIIDDILPESSEDIQLSLQNLSCGADEIISSSATAAVNITDNDNSGTVSLDNASYSISESGGSITITATRANGSDGPASVNFSTANGSAVAGQDFDAVSGTLNWANGESGPKSIVIPIRPDSTVEQDETLTLTLSNPSAGLSLGTSSATVTILDDDSAGTVNLDSATYSVNESAGLVTVSATRSNGSSGSVTVDYSASNGTAIAGQDFDAVAGALSWADGESGTKSIDIPIIADALTEPNETFTVDLSNPTNALALGTSRSTVTIVDQMAPATAGFSIAQETVAEGSAVTVTVERTGGTNGEVRVDYATVNRSALAGSDYTEKSGTLIWSAGDASPKTITIETTADSDTTEQNELFSIRLSSPVGATLGSIDTIDIAITNATPSLSDIDNLTPNQRSVAEALDQSCAAATGEFRQRCDELYLSGMSNDEKRQILDAIVPEQIAAQGSAAVDFGSQQLQTIHGRIIEVRNRRNNGGLSVVGFNMNVDGENVALGRMAQNALNNALGGAAGDEPLRDSPLGFFLKGQIKFGDKNRTLNEKGFDLETKGITLGIDYQFSDALIMGMAAGYGHTNTDFNSNGGDMTTQSGDFAVYGSYFLPQDFYVDWVASYAIHDYEMNRRIAYPGMITTATSNPEGDQYGGSVGVGKDIYIGSFFISPYLRGEYIETTIDQYTEQGGAGFALNVADQSISSLTSTLGSQFSQSISMPWGILAPGARFEWVHQFEDSARAIQSQFVSAPAGMGYFTTLTDSPDRDYFNLGASIAATLPEGRSAFFRYETRLGQANISNHILELGVRIPF